MRNQPGQTRAGALLFVAQGTADDIVQPQVTVAWVAAACRRGERVQFLVMRDASHMLAGKNSAPAAAPWIVDRFSDAAAPDDRAMLKP